MAAGAALMSMNAIFWTVLAAVVGSGSQARLGLRHIAALMACGAVGGLVFHIASRWFRSAESSRNYGPWACAGVTAVFTAVPINAMLGGRDVALEITLFLSTPWMVVLYSVGGALCGYMAGRWVGSLERIA